MTITHLQGYFLRQHLNQDRLLFISSNISDSQESNEIHRLLKKPHEDLSLLLWYANSHVCVQGCRLKW